MAQPTTAQLKQIVTELVDQAHVEMIDLDSLQVDPSYQRPVSNALIEEIAREWNDLASEIILVSKRPDDSLWIVSGQHRVSAAKLKGIDKLLARVVQLSGPTEEAALRVATNVRLSDKPLDRFRAQLAAGNEEAQALVDLLEEFSTAINEVPMADRGINAVSTAQELYRVDDGALLRQVLAVLTEAFGSVGGRIASSSMLKGTGWFLTKHPEANIDRLIEQLQYWGPGELDKRARGYMGALRGSLWMNYYTGMVDIYNTNLTARNSLPLRRRGRWEGISASNEE